MNDEIAWAVVVLLAGAMACGSSDEEDADGASRVE